MPKDLGFRDMVADMLSQYREKATDEIVAAMGPSPDTEDVTPEREKELFWHRSISPEQEAQLWAMPGMTPEKVSREVYKARWTMYDEEMGDLTDEARAKKVNKLGGAAPPASKSPPVAPAPEPEQPSLMDSLAGMGQPAPVPMAPLGGEDDRDTLY